MKLSIIIPAYNEEKRIGSTLSSYSSFFESLRKKKKIDYEILIVINNTTDKTEDIAKKHQKTNKSISYLNLKKGGKGYAIIQGFQESLRKKADFIGFVDADTSTKPEDFYDLFLHINKSDGIIGNRWNKNSRIRKPQTLLRKTASRIFNFIVKSLFLMNYEDTQCGAKIFKKEVIEKITPKILITQWAFDVNLLYLCKIYKFKIIEHPTVWEDKGESKLTVVNTSLKMFLGILRLRLFYSPFRGLIKIYDVLPENLKINHKMI